MTVTALEHLTTELRADEIEWELAPLPTPNFLAMTDEDLLVCAVREAEVYRLLAQQAIHELADREHRLKAAHSTIITLCTELQRYVRARVLEPTC